MASQAAAAGWNSLAPSAPVTSTGRDSRRQGPHQAQTIDRVNRAATAPPQVGQPPSTWTSSSLLGSPGRWLVIVSPHPSR